jgi:hypothetical protein
VHARGLTGSQAVSARNSEYSFALKKVSPEQSWIVSNLGGPRENEPIRDQRDALPLTSLRVGNKLLPQWYREAGFIVKSVDEVERDSQRLVMITFEFSDSQPGTKRYWIRGGTLLLNPGRLWAIEELEYDARSAGGHEERWSSKMTYRPGAAELPVLESVISEGTSSADPGGQVKRVLAFQRFEHRKVPESEFMLSAFGLPELNRPSIWTLARTWFVLVGAGAACIAAALILRYRVAARSARDVA